MDWLYEVYGSVTTNRRSRMSRKKYSREYLEGLVSLSESEMTATEKAALTRSQTQGTSYYGRLPQVFPVHYKRFTKMHDHFVECATGRKARDIMISSAFERDANGLINFILETGPIPSNMKHPTLTRTYPRKGFIRGNLTWKSASTVPTQSGSRRRIDTRTTVTA